VVSIITEIVQKKVAEEVNSAGFYSIQLDTTQDISSTDECAIVIRYVLGSEIHERLLSVVPSHSGTGQGLFDLRKSTLDKLDIDLKKCTSDSTDGAVNCHGEYEGVQAKLTQFADKQSMYGAIHTS